MKNKKGFSLVEILVSITMFVIFSSGYVLFLMQQNIKNDQDEYSVASDNLIREIEEFVENSGATLFMSGTYSFSYNSITNAYTVSPSSNLYVDENGESIAETATGSFKRSVIVNPGTLPFSGSLTVPYISLTTNIWYPGCKRNGNACISKKSTLY